MWALYAEAFGALLILVLSLGPVSRVDGAIFEFASVQWSPHLYHQMLEERYRGASPAHYGGVGG